MGIGLSDCSRWMIPRSWATSRTARSWSMSSTACAGAIGWPSFSTSLLSGSPRTYSITRYRSPPSSPKSWMPTMPGCDRRASARASRRKRSRKTGRLAQWESRNLMATCARSCRWVARYTRPQPPSPRSCSMRYLPSSVVRRRWAAGTRSGRVGSSRVGVRSSALAVAAASTGTAVAENSASSVGVLAREPLGSARPSRGAWCLGFIRPRRSGPTCACRAAGARRDSGS